MGQDTWPVTDLSISSQLSELQGSDFLRDRIKHENMKIFVSLSQVFDGKAYNSFILFTEKCKYCLHQGCQTSGVNMQSPGSHQATAAHFTLSAAKAQVCGLPLSPPASVACPHLKRLVRAVYPMVLTEMASQNVHVAQHCGGLHRDLMVHSGAGA